jgi:hypothetical protein
MTFTTTVTCKEEGPFSTFQEAFTNFWTRFTALINDGTSYQALEWCWIQGTFDNGGKIPLGWEASKNLAYELGILAGRGELQDPAPQIDPLAVERAFEEARQGVIAAAEQDLADAVGELVVAVAETPELSDDVRKPLLEQLGSAVAEFTALRELTATGEPAAAEGE